MRTLIFSMMIASTFVLAGCTPADDEATDAPAADAAAETEASAEGSGE